MCECAVDIRSHLFCPQVKTLAMPAMSVGYMRFPAAESTQLMLKSINDYIVQHQQSTNLQQIYLIDNSDSVVNHFQESAVKTFGKTAVTIKSQTLVPDSGMLSYDQSSS